MDKFDGLMRSIVDYLDGTRLSRADHPALTDRGPISGNSEAEINDVELKIGKQIPASLKAWYRVAGKVPPYLYDYDADYSLADLVSAQETAEELTAYEVCEWKLSDTSLPFSQRIGEQFLLVASDRHTDDPPVFHYLEGSSQPTLVDIAFSTHIREVWLSWLDFPARDKENISEIGSWRDKGYDTWFDRMHVLDELRAETRAFRRRLLQKVHQEDLTRNEITGPIEFQKRWLDEFRASDIRRKLLSASMRLPYNWINPPN